MPKQTEKYRLGYYLEGERTDGITEFRRWTTLDAQLRGLYEVVGNGVLSGWDVTSSSDTPLGASVTSGAGVISFVSAESTASNAVAPLFPSSTNYIYATITPTTFWDKSVTFWPSLVLVNPDDSILLAAVVTDSTKIASIDTSVRNTIGLVSAINEAIRNHHHTGADGMPDLVNLATEVQGTLSQANMPDLDASLITTGTLDKARMPKIDHITGLQNQGTLTHGQIDSFIDSLSQIGKTLMGETALVNLLQLVLALKHQWPEVDDFLVNELAFIPGISPDSLIDTANTTAVVDTRPESEGGQHTISGTSGPAYRVTTKTWDSPSEFEGAERLRTVVDGDIMRLENTETKVMVDDFEEVSDWKTQITDLSASAGILELDPTTKVIGEYSAKVGVNIDNTTNLAFTLTKTFAAQDWSGYDRVVFYLFTDSVEHGDIYFYINDATYGVQDSFSMVLERNAPTINRDTLLNGWREVSVDLTKFNRSAVNTIGFFTSSQTGWDSGRPFTLNIDDMYLTTGNRFSADGWARFVYGGTPQDFWQVRWDSLLPSGTTIKGRTRLANDVSYFDQSSPVQAPWSAYSPSFAYPNSHGSFLVSNPTGQQYSYIQIEVLFGASNDRKWSPELHRLYADSRISASQTEFLYDTQDQWESGRNFDVDTTTDPGSIRIAAASEADDFFYGKVGDAVQADSDFATKYDLTGLNLPVSTRQALGKTGVGFGQLSCVRRGSGGSIWVADTDNDRVLELDKAGNVLFGVWGSVLTDPLDVYGDEDNGPGSNPAGATVNPATPSTGVPVPELLHSMYNPNTGILTIVWNNDIETIHDTGTTFDRDKLFLAAGPHRVYFSDATAFSVWGIDGPKYDAWRFSTNKYVGQFTFFSHVLQAQLTQADTSTLNTILSFATPSVAVASLNEQQLIGMSSVTITVTTPNFLVGNESSDNNGIRWSLDGNPYQYTKTRSQAFSGLSGGVHEVNIRLVDKNNTPLANAEAETTISLAVETLPYQYPHIAVTSPKMGQTISSTSVNVAFQVVNHPITPAGSHLQYQVDGGAKNDWRLYSPIPLTGLSDGQHSVTLILVDEYGQEIVAAYSRVTATFNAGVASAVGLRLYADRGMIRGSGREDSSVNAEGSVDVNVANMYLENLYCPVDMQVIPSETSVVNPSGTETILVAKLRSPTTTLGLSSQEITTSQVSTPVSDTAIYGTAYLDGHSAIQYGLSGNVIFTNNASQFADTRENAKNWLGGGNKTSDGELMMADAIRHRAIITSTDLSTQETRVIWEHDSDRLVTDFQMVRQEPKVISVGGSSATPSELYVKAGSEVIWRNDSAIPITIYSGKTTPETFAADPDLTLYGDDFTSQELQPGEAYAFTFDNVGSFSWFAYPDIQTGSVISSGARISSTDQYLVLEKEETPSVYGSRVVRVDAWGNVVWDFGEGILYDPKDVRSLAGNSVIVSV